MDPAHADENARAYTCFASPGSRTRKYTGANKVNAFSRKGYFITNPISDLILVQLFAYSEHHLLFQRVPGLSINVPVLALADCAHNKVTPDCYEILRHSVYHQCARILLLLSRNISLPVLLLQNYCEEHLNYQIRAPAWLIVHMLHYFKRLLIAFLSR